MNKGIRFDDAMGHRQQSSTDKFAPIREVFEKWSNLKSGGLPDYFNLFECIAEES